MAFDVLQELERIQHERQRDREAYAAFMRALRQAEQESDPKSDLQRMFKL